MPNLVTRYMHQKAAELFYEDLRSASNSYYLQIARITPWDDDTSPPSLSASIDQEDFDFWINSIAAKKVQASDITFVAPRYNWANNTVYREWDNTNGSLFAAPASSNTFYIITDEFNVYKCLYNNKGTSSTVKPTGTSTALVRTSDGYVWKFMYQVSAGNRIKFLTADWMPVQTLTANNGSYQWTVQQAASNGSIQVIDLKNVGNNYLMTNGTFSSVTSNTVVVLANTADTIDNIYNGSTLYIDSGLGATQIKEVVDYVGSTRTATLASALNPSPNTSSTYIVGPKITIAGDGSGATAYANVATANNTGAPINQIIMISTGTNYSRAAVTVSANSSHGSGANAIPFLPAPGGHGSDAVSELDGRYVMQSVQTGNTVGGTFPIVNDFRVFGVVKNPTLSQNGALASGSEYDLTTQLTLTSVTGSGLFTLDEIINGSTSGQTAKVVSFSNTNSANTAGVLRITTSNGIFSNTETITGNTSSVQAVISGIQTANINMRSGKVIYIENISPIERDIQQTEDFRIVFKF